MPVFQLVNKVVLGELSAFGPSLSTFNGQLALSWIGTDGQFNMLLSSDGANWGSKRTFPLAVSSVSGPPALGLGNSGLGYPSEYVACRDSADQSLLLLEFLVASEGNGNSTGEYTTHAPSLSSQYIAWTGTGDGFLNLATVQPGTTDGSYAAAGYIAQKMTSAESSDGGPCLCDLAGETLIGWRGSGNYVLNVAVVQGGNINNKQVLGETSDFGPALAGVGNDVYLAWTGSGNPQLNLMSSSAGYGSFGGKTVFADSSDSGPALAAFNGGLFLAWRGSGNNNLNVARVTGGDLGNA